MIELTDECPSADAYFTALIRSVKPAADFSRLERRASVPVLIKKSMDIEEITENICVIKLKNIAMAESPRKNTLDIIIYLCGGAFALIDNTDLWIMDRLLPLLAESGSEATAYSIIYETDSELVNKRDECLFSVVRRQLLNGFKIILNHAFKALDPKNKPNLRIMLSGTSAGGNLALCCIPDLQSELKENFSDLFKEVAVKLTAPSPWADLHATDASPYFIQRQKDDFLSTDFLNESRDKYLKLLPNLEIISEAAKNIETLLFAKLFAIELRYRNITTLVFDFFDCLNLIPSDTSVKIEDLDTFLKQNTDLLAALESLNIDIKFIMNPPLKQDLPLEDISISELSGYVAGDELLKAAVKHLFRGPRENVSLSCQSYEGPKSSLWARFFQFIFGSGGSADQFPGTVVFSRSNKGVLNPVGGFTLRHAIAYIREKYPSTSFPDATQALDAALEELVDKHMDNILAVATDGLSEDDRVNLGLVNPMMASNDVLADLPPSLIFAGQKEMFLEQIILFHKRVQRAKKERRAESRLVIAKNAYHAFVPFWRSPLHRMFNEIGLGWLFYWFHPHRYYAWRSYGRRRIPTDSFVHCVNADRAIQMTADFFLSTPSSSLSTAS